MLRKAFIDDQLAARQFNTGETVRKSGLRGLMLSPYAGRVLYSNVDTGIVQVQWPWGAELEFASELVHDVSFTLRPPTMDQSYSTWEGARNINDSANVESDVEWRSKLSSEIVAGYEARTMPVYRAACKAMHEGKEEVEAFMALANSMSEEFGTDAVRITVSNLWEAGRRMAIYWVDPKRQYRVTQKEKNGGVLSCPRCKGVLKPRVYRQGKRVLCCKGCGFTISPRDLKK
jgi:predicted nucleic acid-binding Zn ribbon protein